MSEKPYIPKSFLECYGISRPEDDQETYELANTHFQELTRDEQLEHITGFNVESFAITLGYDPENPNIAVLREARELLEVWAKEPITDPYVLFHRARNASNYDKEVGMLKGDVEAGRITENERQLLEHQLYLKYKQDE